MAGVKEKRLLFPEEQLATGKTRAMREVTEFCYLSFNVIIECCASQDGIADEILPAVHAIMIWLQHLFTVQNDIQLHAKEDVADLLEGLEMFSSLRMI